MTPPAAGHRVVAGPFASLEPLLLEEIDRLKAGDPLAPVEVLVGSNLLSVYLRRAYAASRGAAANIRFLTFLDLARDLAPEADRRPPLPDLAPRRLARQALAASRDSRFRDLAATPGVADALVRTADDLRDAGIDAATLPRLAARLDLDADRAPILGEVVEAVARFDASRRRFADPTATLERAAASPGGSATPLLVYGLSDLGPLRERVLDAAAAGRRVVAFVPSVPGLADDETVRVPLFERLLGVPASRLGDGVPIEPDWVVAPSDAAEAREVARRILALSEEGIPLHRAAVLLRDPRTQEGPIVAELRRLDLPFYRPAGSPPSTRPSGRVARALFDLADEPRRETLLELLDLLETLGLLEVLAPGGTSAARLRSRLERFTLPGSLAAWRGRVAEAREREKDPPPELVDLGKALDVLAEVVPPASAARPSAWARRLARGVKILFRGVAPDAVAAATEALAALDVATEAYLGVDEARDLLLDALDLETPAEGRFEAGVALLSAATARGLLFDAVLVPGLVDGVFPKPPRPDPLLYDEERAQLARLSGRRVPPRAGERPNREERFLFETARRAARKRLVFFTADLVLPADAVRPRLASSFVAAELDEKLRADRARVVLPAVRRVPPRPATDVEEALLQVAARGAGPEAVAAASEPLRRALIRARARRSGAFTEFDGLVGRAPRTGLVLPEIDLSISALERFTTCPLRGFFASVLRIDVRDDEEDDAPLPDAREKGALVHDALFRLARDVQTDGRVLGDLDEDEAERRGREIARDLVAGRGHDAGPAAPVFGDLLRAEIEEAVRRAVAHERGRADRLPLGGAEVRFGRARPGVVEDPALALADPLRVEREGPVAFLLSGRIDRLDRSAGASRVVDYKTGRASKADDASNPPAIAGGERMQLPAYALAARALGATGVASEFQFLGGDAMTAVASSAERTQDAIRVFGEALDHVAALVSSGSFLPVTTSVRDSELTTCRFCDYRRVCGPGHVAVFERKMETGGRLQYAVVRALKGLP